MTPATTMRPTCGALRRAQASPCKLDPFHPNNHTNALGEDWPRMGPIFCTRCKREAANPALVSHQEVASGPGYAVWACSPTCPE